MSSHQYFLEQAIELAERNAQSLAGGPFGAVIVYQGQVIAACANQVTANHDPTAHAEIQAIRTACARLNDFQLHHCILYSSCEPCPMCLGAIYWARLKAVYFAADRLTAAQAGFDDAMIYQQIATDLEQRSIPMTHLAITGHDRPFHSWLQSQARIPY
ncbi:MAG: nucleoside deaminase [Methylococcales bacterium]|nr:nucleoside deaminase [Methylococcales bacterium]